MVAIIVWILELLLMIVLAHTEPSALIYDNMIGGIVYSMCAWIPALMVEALWK